jgi:hypothetical protein
MERVFSNLYRIGGEPDKRGQSHSYLLVRKTGNLFICHQSVPTPEEVKEIKQLGGIASQWVCHHHDANRKGGHYELFKTFGCALHLHKADRAGARGKTKCTLESFDDAGLTLDKDFEAIYMPMFTRGNTVFRWRNRGKYYLFSSHTIYPLEDEWRISLNRHTGKPWGPGCRIWQAQAIRPALARLKALHVDYVIPGYTEVGDDTFYQLDDRERRALTRALNAQLKAADHLWDSRETLEYDHPTDATGGG